MVGKTFIVLSAVLIHFANSDWVKLPDITNRPRDPYKVQTISSFSELPSSSILANSDLISSVFSYESQPGTSLITEMTPTTVMKQSTQRKIFFSTVTSKTIEFVGGISDRLDNNEIQVEVIPIQEESRRVIFANQTIPFKTLVGEKKPSIKAKPENTEDEDDESVIVSDDEELTSSEEATEEYYDEENEEQLATTSTTTTKAPRKLSRRPSKLNPQRRVIQNMKMKPSFHNHLSFANFLKFLKNIQQSFTKRTAKNINEKINMLRDFRDNLLLTINQRIKSLWKTKEKKEHRVKRTLGGGGGWMEQGGGAMDFPSAEAALLSISFLTFAVFLIKLVLVSKLWPLQSFMGNHVYFVS
jgi:hypothetical protein